MKTISVVHLFLLLKIIFVILEPWEYCIADTFSPHCPQGEILMVTSAKYGRMKIGKCVQVNLGMCILVY